MSDVRLIERWLPIAALGEESVRERRFSMAGNVLPPHNSLHVWWARRPLIASRAALLACCLPASFDHEQFLPLIGILGDPVAARRRNDAAIRMGKVPIGDKEYGYPRAFKHYPNLDKIETISPNNIVTLDPTAGGGTIPYEASRLGFTSVANDLNPVSATVMDATINFPVEFGAAIVDDFSKLAHRAKLELEKRMQGIYPKEVNARVEAYL